MDNLTQSGLEHARTINVSGTSADGERETATLRVDAADLYDAASTLKEDGFDLFLFASGVDFQDEIELVYRLYSAREGIAVFLKTCVSKSEPVVDSLTPLWPAANWHEREVYDLFGVSFRGHPNLRRIFMPEDSVGHPLRKDYRPDDARAQGRYDRAE